LVVAVFMGSGLFFFPPFPCVSEAFPFFKPVTAPGKTLRPAGLVAGTGFVRVVTLFLFFQLSPFHYAGILFPDAMMDVRPANPALALLFGVVSGDVGRRKNAWVRWGSPACLFSQFGPSAAKSAGGGRPQQRWWFI